MKQQTKDKSIRDELFTGGDWIAGNDGHSVTAEFDDGYKILCQVENPNDSLLISQAPAMYRALEEYVKDCENSKWGYLPEHLQKVKKILQKANPKP